MLKLTSNAWVYMALFCGSPVWLNLQNMPKSISAVVSSRFVTEVCWSVRAFRSDLRRSLLTALCSRSAVGISGRCLPPSRHQIRQPPRLQQWSI